MRKHDVLHSHDPASISSQHSSISARPARLRRYLRTSRSGIPRPRAPSTSIQPSLLGRHTLQASQLTMCRSITLQCSCGCTAAAKLPIKHCPDGIKLRFTCRKYNPSIKNTIKKSFECARCCSIAIQQAQSRLSQASSGLEAARAGGDDRATRVARSIMERANKDFNSEASKHARCALARSRDKD